MARLVVGETTQTRRTINRLCTRGLGRTQLLVTQGYVGPPAFVVVALQRNFGQSGLKRRQRDLDLVVVWAKLIEINDKAPSRNVEGFVKVAANRERNFASVMAEHVSSRVRKVLSTLKVFAQRIK